MTPPGAPEKTGLIRTVAAALRRGAFLAVALATSTVVLVFADRLQRRLGERAVIAFERLMGLVLIAIAVEMILKGVRAFVLQLH